jgi:CheY-like chemotaxis protein
MSKASILVVEDNWDLREALSDTLEFGGYDVFAVEGGEQALQALSQRRVDLLVSDINMDGMDGHELLVRVPCYAGYSDHRLWQYWQFSTCDARRCCRLSAQAV